MRRPAANSVIVRLIVVSDALPVAADCTDLSATEGTEYTDTNPLIRGVRVVRGWSLDPHQPHRSVLSVLLRGWSLDPRDPWRQDWTGMIGRWNYGLPPAGSDRTPGWPAPRLWRRPWARA